MEGGEHREVVHTDNGVILRIHNFSLADYGLYMCRCVNMYDYAQFKICGAPFGLPSHCAATMEVALLPTGIYTTQLFVCNAYMYPMTTIPTQVGMMLSW